MIERQARSVGWFEVGSTAKCLLATGVVVAGGALVFASSPQLVGVAIGIIGIVAVAFLNGANDLPKSIATLIGSESIRFEWALVLGSAATLAGGLAAMLWAGKLLSLFSSGGITTVSGLEAPFFPLAVIAGSAAWVLFATKAGLPVSTTHALVGASVGGALLAEGADGVRWGTLIVAVAIPLLAGPVLGGLAGYGIGKVTSGHQGSSKAGLKRRLHVLSAIGAAFARSLNDTPKLVGVGLLAFELEGGSGTRNLLIVVAVLAMVAGGLWASRKVISTLAYRITALDSDTGLAANATNAGLVGAASLFGLPLSTTHVSGAALVGSARGAGSKEIRWPVVRDIAYGWIVTVPAAAALAAVFWMLATSFGGLV